MRNNKTIRRIVALYTILDTSKELSAKQLIEKLDRDYNIKIERKTIYHDIAALTEFMPIAKKRRGHTIFYVADWSLLRKESEVTTKTD